MNKKLFILLFSFVTYFLLLGGLYFSIVNLIGKSNYPLDDTYIHMSISENLAEYGTWWINCNEFSSAFTFPLFTIVFVSYFLIFGVNELAPLIINTVVSVLLIYIIWDYFKNKISEVLLFFLLLAIIIFTPLPTMSMIAMKHLLHALLMPLVISLFFYSFYQLYLFLVEKITLKKEIMPSFLCLLSLDPLYNLFKRSVRNYIDIIQPFEEIYPQQYQAAKFKKKFYSNHYVVINHIGYSSFFSNSYIANMYGLGNKNIAINIKNN